MNVRKIACFVALASTVAVARGQAPQPDAKTKLGGPARDLNPPLNANPLPVTNKPLVLIYYVNETSPDATESKNLVNLLGWLRETGHPEIVPHADSIEFDTKKFPRVVAEELRALQSTTGGEAKLRPDVVYFNNQLAQQSKFLVLRREQPDRPEEHAFALSAQRPGIYATYPLADTESLRRALSAAAGVFPAAKYEYVLITKSHGAGSIVVAPRYQFVAESAKREVFMNRIMSEYQASLAARLQGSEPLFAAHQKLADAEGRGLVTKNGLLYWEKVGRVQLARSQQANCLADRAGTPFLTADNKKIVVAKGRLTLEGTEHGVLDAAGKPVEVLAILTRGVSNLRSPDRDLMPPSMRPQFIPIIKSKATAGAVVSKTSIALPRLEYDNPSTPILGSDKATMPILDGDKATMPILDGDKATMPILDGDKMTMPILARDKFMVPSLGSTGSGDSTLNTHNLSEDTLDSGSGTLNSNTTGNDTLNSSSVGSVTLAGSGFSGGRSYGITKAQLVGALRQSSEKQSMLFRLIFLESCNSELPTDLVRQLKSPELAKSVGQVWSSDCTGLQYSTLDLGAIMKRLGPETSFLTSLQASLQAKYEEDQAARGK